MLLSFREWRVTIDTLVNQHRTTLDLQHVHLIHKTPGNYEAPDTKYCRRCDVVDPLGKNSPSDLQPDGGKKAVLHSEWDGKATGNQAICVFLDQRSSKSNHPRVNSKPSTSKGGPSLGHGRHGASAKEPNSRDITQLLLLMAGDVESNPGPKQRQSSGSDGERDFDDILKKIACSLRGNQAIDDIGKALGFHPAEIERYLKANILHDNVTYDGTLKMLRDWREKQTTKEELPALRDALRSANQVQLADTYLPTYAPDPLFERVAEETKQYYLKDMCTIQADPLDDETLFNFGDIFTNLTLLEVVRNWHITCKTPLSFSDLLKTKIGGLPAKRILVEGEGGAGKTTFCTKIAWDWAQGVGFQQFKLVVVIFLRKAKNRTVGEIVKTYLSDGNPIEAKQIDAHILSNPDDVFLVLDGLDEFDGDVSGQIFQIIFNTVFRSSTVLVTTRQWKVHVIRSVPDLKRIYAYVAIEGFSAENLSSYIEKFFGPDTPSSQDLISFINDNDVVRENMATFPLYVAMLCIMWKEYDGERREAMALLKTFSQLFKEMITFLVEHYLPKESRSLTALDKRRLTITHHLTKIGKIAFEELLEKRLVFSEDTFQACQESMEIGCKVGVLTREKRPTSQRDRRASANLAVSNVQFPHKLFQEYLSALYLASLHGSDRRKYTEVMANIVDNAYEFKYLLYFTSAQNKEVGLDIVKRLLTKRKGGHFIVDVAYESQYQSVAKEVGNQLMKTSSKLEIVSDMSAHTIAGHIFVMEHRGGVKGLILKKSCAHNVSQDLAEFMCSSPSLRYVEIGCRPVGTRTARQFQASILPDVFYSVLADRAAHSKIEDLKIYSADLLVRPSASSALAHFICQMPHLRSLEFYNTKLDHAFFTKLASTAKVNAQRRKHFTSLIEFIVDDNTLSGWQSYGERFDSVEKVTVNVRDDVDADISQWLRGLKGVTELTIQRHEYMSTTCDLLDNNGLLNSLLALLAAFPNLIKMTFRDITIGNTVAEFMLENIRASTQNHLKMITLIRCNTDEDLVFQESNIQVKVEHGEPQSGHVPTGRTRSLRISRVQLRNTCCSCMEGISQRLRGCLSNQLDHDSSSRVREQGDTTYMSPLRSTGEEQDDSSEHEPYEEQNDSSEYSEP